MFFMWCEYDFGQEGIVFENEKCAKSWLDTMIEQEGSISDNAQTLFDDGLASLTPCTFIYDNSEEKPFEQPI